MHKIAYIILCLLTVKLLNDTIHIDMKKTLLLLLILELLLTPSLVYAGPQSTTYELKQYEFGAGGTDNAGSDTTNYTIFGTAGETANGTMQSTNYTSLPGLIYTMQANVPAAPTFTNPATYYNKLHIVLDTGSNPSDAQFAIAISTDNFVTDTTHFIQADDTIGTTITWQTNAVWGASGFDVIGLAPGTTYTIKVTAKQGNFTQSPYSATAQVATSNSTLTFDLDIAPTDSETASPYNIALGSLTAGSVTTASDKIWIDLSTNAENGGIVYIYDAFAGLKSSNLNYTISSSTSNLTSSSEGFGVQVSTATNLTALTPYDGSSQNVGVVDSTIRKILDSGGNAVSGGRASLSVKAKTSTTTPAASDYADTFTIIASGAF